MSTFTQSMFDSIKSALANTNSGASNSRVDILRFTPDNQYDLRFIPNVKSPEKTFHHYYTQAWTSFSTGQYVSAVSPQTIGQPCPIASAKFKLLNTGTEEEKNKASTIRRAENWLVNVYVLNDPTKPENNGQVKVMRFGKQLHKIIMDSIQDEDESGVGMRAFDLSENGCNFRVKVEKQGDFPTYVTSKFLLPSALNATEEPDVLIEKASDLETIFPIKSNDEMLAMLDQHFYTEPASQSTAEPVASVPSKTADPDLDEDLPMGDFDTKSTPKKDDDQLEELLAGLDD